MTDPQNIHLQAPPYWPEALDYLKAKDTIMAELIKRYDGEVVLHSQGDAFATLARAIIGQQISVKAAASVWRKMEQNLNTVSATTIQNASQDQLRSCGLSRQKIQYLQNIAEEFRSNRLNDSALKEMPDKDVESTLVRIKGVGVWTAEMFLIFYLLRPDIFPIADIGLLKAVDRNYNAGKPMEGGKTAYLEIAQNWQPFRTVATWYLWRSLDPHPVLY